MCPVFSNFTFITIILCVWPLWYLIISENFDISCNNFAIIFVIIKLATKTIFQSSSLELKDRKVSDPKVMLKPEFVKKKSLRLKFVNVGIGHPPVQMPMSGYPFSQWLPMKLASKVDDFYWSNSCEVMKIKQV